MDDLMKAQLNCKLVTADRMDELKLKNNSKSGINQPKSMTIDCKITTA